MIKISSSDKVDKKVKKGVEKELSAPKIGAVIKIT